MEEGGGDGIDGSRVLGALDADDDAEGTVGEGWATGVANEPFLDSI